MYTTTNFKTKTALKNAVKAGEQVTVFQPNDMFGQNQKLSTFTGTQYIEGPHYPEPHKWYATVKMVNGIVVKVA